MSSSNMRNIIGLGLSTALLLGLFGCQAAPQDKWDKLKHQLQQEQDAREIQNLMSRRAYVHGASDQTAEVDMYAQRDDSSFCQNQGCRIGIDNIRFVFSERFLKVRMQQLATLQKLYPEIEVNEEWLHAGNIQMHTIGTPIIEIAEDGQTAKGMWYTPGTFAWTNEDTGIIDASWIWEKYAVDFIKEDGEWKFWHIMVVTDFVMPFGKSFDAIIQDAPEGAEGVSTANEEIPTIPRDLDIPFYKALSPTTVPVVFPPMPEPYKTFSETFTYGPELIIEMEKKGLLPN